MRTAAQTATLLLSMLIGLTSAAVSDNSDSNGVFSCNRNGMPTIISSTAGLIQTPRFPQQFPLPLHCAWIIDNSGNHGKYVNIYFNKFYLRPGFLTVSVHNDSLAARRAANANSSDQNWHEHDHVTSMDKYVTLNLRISDGNMNKMHMRALEVYDSYGFEIAFEISKSKRRDDYCSLSVCSFTGECQVTLDETKQKIGSFHCACTLPNRPERIYRAFEGSNCEKHTVMEECGFGSRNKCSNRGQCRYMSSRHITCTCDTGYSGRFCETKTSSQYKDNVTEAQRCPKEFVVLNVIRDLYKISRKLWQYLDKFNGSISLFGDPDDNDSGLLYIHSINETALSNEVYFYLVSQFYSSFGDSLTGRPILQQGICAKSLVVKPELPLPERDQFHLSCFVVTGPNVSNVAFNWIKDDVYSVNTSMATRFMLSYVAPDKEDGSSDDAKALVGLLTIKEANRADNGKFECRATAENLNRLQKIDFIKGKFNWGKDERPFQSTVSASFHVTVALKPDIEVFPRSLTVLKTQQAMGTLHCVAGKYQLRAEEVQHYSFKWLKNYDNDEQRQVIGSKDFQGTEFVEEVWLSMEGKIRTYGLLLRLGNLEADANYTCEVEDNRRSHFSDEDNAKMVSRINVTVFVAENESEVCEACWEGGLEWPITKVSTVAIRQCNYEGSGFVTHKCNPTTEMYTPVWEKKLNTTSCISPILDHTERQLSRFWNGYVNETENVTLPLGFFKVLSKEMKSVLLHDVEWDIINKISLQVLEYLKRKSFVTSDITEFLVWFFRDFTTWLLDHGTGHLQPNSYKHYMDLFKLVNRGARLFASKLEFGKPYLVPPHSRSRRCQRTLTVKMVRLQPPFAAQDNITFLTLDQRRPNGREHYQQEEQSNYLREEEDKVSICSHHNTNVTISAAKDATKMKTVLNFAIIHFPRIDHVLNESYNVFNPGFIRSFNSSIVTVSAESEGGNELQLDIMISVRFYDFRFGRNDTSWRNLSCARLDHTSQPTPRWNYEDKECHLLWHPRGLTCNCKQPGSFALVWTGPVVTKVASPPELLSPLVLALSCGAALTMCSLALAILLRQLWSKPRSLVTLIQAGSTACLVAVMIIIILALTMPQKHLHWWTPVALQLLLLQTLSLQMCQAVTVLLKRLFSTLPKRARIVTYAMSLSLPFVYCCLLLGLAGPDHRIALLEDHLLRSPESTSFWFVQFKSEDFYAFVFCNLCCFVFYLIIFFLTRKTSVKKLEDGAKESLLQKSSFITLSVILFNLACSVFVNMCQSEIMQYILTFSALIVGVVMFIISVASSEGGGNLSGFGRMTINRMTNKSNDPTVVDCHLTSDCSPPTETEKGSLLSCPNCSSVNSSSPSRISCKRKDSHLAEPEDSSVRGRSMESSSSFASNWTSPPFYTKDDPPPKMHKIKCLLSLESVNGSSSSEDYCDSGRIERCSVDVHHHNEKSSKKSEVVSPMPPPLTAIVEQAQQEANVEFLTQISSQSARSLFPLVGHPNSSISSNESGCFINSSRKNSSNGETASLFREALANPLNDDSDPTGHYVPMSVVERHLTRKQRPRRISKQSSTSDDNQEDQYDDDDDDLSQRTSRFSSASSSASGQYRQQRPTAETDLLLAKTRVRLRQRKCSTGDTAFSSEQDSVVEDDGQPMMEKDILSTSSTVLCHKQQQQQEFQKPQQFGTKSPTSLSLSIRT